MKNRKFNSNKVIIVNKETYSWLWVLPSKVQFSLLNFTPFKIWKFIIFSAKIKKESWFVIKSETVLATSRIYPSVNKQEFVLLLTVTSFYYLPRPLTVWEINRQVAHCVLQIFTIIKLNPARDHFLKPGASFSLWISWWYASFQIALRIGNNQQKKDWDWRQRQKQKKTRVTMKTGDPRQYIRCVLQKN